MVELTGRTKAGRLWSSGSDVAGLQQDSGEHLFVFLIKLAMTTNLRNAHGAQHRQWR